MHKASRIIAVAVALMLVATPCLADQSGLKTVFQDAFYGGLTGGLVGAAVLAFTKKPGQHLDFIGYGAAGGVLVGATYGAVVASRSLAEVDKGRVKFALPTITPEIREPNSKGQVAIIATAELLRGRF